MNANLPILKMYAEGITADIEPVVVHGIRVRAGKVLTFHVHLECGAHYSLLPIHSISTIKDARKIPADQLQPWDCFSDKCEVHVFSYFQFRRVSHCILGEGEYWCTIDFYDNSFSDDPSEFKQFHLIKLDNGRIAACPNNYLLFQEKTFTGSVNWGNVPIIQRQKEFISVER